MYLACILNVYLDRLIILRLLAVSGGVPHARVSSAHVKRLHSSFEGVRPNIRSNSQSNEVSSFAGVDMQAIACTSVM